MINQPEILKHLKDAFKDEQALALTHAITLPCGWVSSRDNFFTANASPLRFAKVHHSLFQLSLQNL